MRVIAKAHTLYALPFLTLHFSLSPAWFLYQASLHRMYIFEIHRFSEMNDGLKICLRTNYVTAIISTRINSQLSIQSWGKKFPLLRLLHVIE